MHIGERDFDEIIQLLTRETGIVPRESHKTGIRRYLEEHFAALNDGSVPNYASYLFQNPAEWAALVNQSTVNETYFFREERQLDLLKTTIFPALLKTNATLNIWSAACSSGEEIYSLALLARASNVRATYTASDINTAVLEKCKAGVYGANSVRSVDGAKYHALLAPYKTKDANGNDCYQLGAELTGSIITTQLNLSDLARAPLPQNLPKNQHIIFIRNVFIYFTRNMRAQILKTLATTCLADGGYLFVSLSEIASIDSGIIPPELEKIVGGNVFYFHKKV